MEIKTQFIVNVKGSWQILFITENGDFYITSNGGFGQRDLYIESISADEAKQLLNQTKQD